ncbi:hypothetical protein PI124_g24814 [Phytophthora idaei]|nr:hypothetical protein PI125_g27102 [Phytophthora idaei]KAG3114823.1 hypothetical protein PI126_g24711 [Phytophthora idaei]KAG3230087.1 hypothetical protein PI124_g24814 [Phytophthora idaei]
MLKDNSYRSTMFKQWDLYKLDAIPAEIGAKNLENQQVAKMFLDYKRNGRLYAS